MNYLKKLIPVLIFAICFSFNVYAGIRPKAQEFPDKTIIIGTHAVYIDSLTEDIFEKANETAQTEGQEKIYFKSDINKGVWYDITGQTDITQISESTDNVVSNETIDSLILTYYTNPKGETIDLSTGEKIDISSVSEITNPVNMEELSGLSEELGLQKSLYESEEDDDKKDIYEENFKSIEKVLAVISEEDISALDEKLKAMEDYIVYLNGKNEVIDKINIASEIKSDIEDEKNGICYQEVLDRINGEIESLDYMNSKDLIDKYTEFATKIQSSLDNLGIEDSKEEDSSGNAFVELEKKYSEELLNGVLNKDYVKADNYLNKLYALNQIINNYKAANSSEKETMLDVLNDAKDFSISSLNNLAANGVNAEDYNKALLNGENAGVLAKIKEESIDELKNALNNISLVDEFISDMLDSDFEKEKELEKSKNAVSNAINTMVSSEMSQEAKNILKENEDILSDKIFEVKLLQSEEYKEAKELAQEYKEQADKLNEMYLGAVEEGDKQLQEDLKTKLENTVSQMINAEDNLEKLKEDYKNGNKTIDSLNKDDKNSEEPNEEKNEENPQNTEKEGDLKTEEGSDSDKQEDTTESKEAVKEDGAENYTDEEIAAIKAETKRLNGKFSEYEFINPWNIKFKDYSVKLFSPVFKNGSEIFVPARELGLNLGAQVIYSKANNAAVIKAKGALIEISQEQNEIYVNDKKMTLSKDPVNIEGKIYISLKCFEKAFSLSETEEDDFIIVYKD